VITTPPPLSGRSTTSASTRREGALAKVRPELPKRQITHSGDTLVRREAGVLGAERADNVTVPPTLRIPGPGFSHR